ncbi:MAG TPA: aminotransferase class V-fold PLP-dependent enzyme [Woeseiaceae bacterium]|nr:aminotransferase class V-fold PLP-dependent enzyme [Woeseiaceae bacterium]
MTGATTGDDGPIYLDYAASTPLDPAVAAGLAELLTATAGWANPSAGHAAGRRAMALVNAAAARLAALLNCDARQLVFTSGATESNNLAIQGAAAYRAARGRHLVTLRTEHRAVTDVFRALEKRGYDVTWLSPRPDGRLDPGALEAALRPDTQLVSAMHVNNETGVIQDIAAIGRLCHANGTLLHVDAAQSFGKLPIDLAALPVDFLSATAHKIYGPKGVGVLYVSGRAGAHVEPLMFGGGQQRGLRPGTLPAWLIAGFGLAAELAAGRMAADHARLGELQDRLWHGIRDLPGLRRNGSAEYGFPGILNVSAAGVEGESLLLDLEPLCVAAGSACNSRDRSPSGVLRALGLTDAEARSAIRFSFGRRTTLREIDIAARRYRDAVLRLRALSPAVLPPGPPPARESVG